MKALLALLLVAVAAACGGSSAGSGSGAAVLAVDRLDFGLAGIGETASAPLTVKARGGKVRLLGAEVEGPFAATIDEPIELAVGRPATVEVRFTPPAEGAAAGLLLLRTSNGTLELPLAGEGVGPELACTPAEVVFGPVPFGSTAEETVSCTNRSAVTWTLRADAPEGDDPGGFTAVDEGVPREVTSGGRFEARVWFGGRTGHAEAVLPIRTRGGLLVAELPLSAEGTGAAIETVPAAACPGGLDVGWVPPGGTLRTQLALRNRGPGPVTVTDLGFDGAGFSVTRPVPFELPADDPATADDEGRLDLEVVFAPEAEGAASARLEVGTDDPALPLVEFCLRGFGGGPALACEPSALDFGPVAGGLPETRTVTCRNAGTALPAAYRSELLLTAASSGDGFTVTPATPLELSPGEEAPLVVTFDPASTGPATGALTVTSNDPTHPERTIPLAAEGLVAAPCQAEFPGTLDLGDVPVGTELTLPVIVRNAGAEACLVRDVALVEVNDPLALALAGDPPEARILAPGASLRVPLRFRIDGMTTVNGELSFTLSDPAQPRRSVAVRARGIVEPACLFVVPRTIDLGTVAPGCTSLQAQVRVRNVCGGPVPFTDIEFLGDPGLRLAGEPMPGPAEVPVAGFVFHVEVAPTADGPIEAAVRLRDEHGPVSHLVPVRADVGDPDGSDVFEPRSQVDVLWVSDNSGGMGPYHLGVRWSAASYLAAALERPEVDFHLGVTTSGITPGGACPGGASGQEDGRLFPVDNSRPRIVTRQTPDAADTFGQNVVTGDCHFDEQSLEGALRAISPPASTSADDPRYSQPNDGNLGFLRRGAALAVVFLTDEYDQSPRSVSHYVDMTRWRIERTFREGLATFHAITGDKGTGCSGNGSSATAGDRVIAASEATGGRFESICWANPADALLRLGQATFGRTRFPLSAKPADVDGDGKITFAGGDLQVLQNGRPLTMTGTPWTWNEAENAVDFALDWMPDPARPVEIRYTPACL